MANRQQDKPRRRWWRWLLRGLLLVAVLSLGVSGYVYWQWNDPRLAAGWVRYVAQQQLSEQAALAIEGIELDWRGGRVNARGLVLRLDGGELVQVAGIEARVAAYVMEKPSALKHLRIDRPRITISGERGSSAGFDRVQRPGPKPAPISDRRPPDPRIEDGALVIAGVRCPDVDIAGGLLILRDYPWLAEPGKPLVLAIEQLSLKPHSEGGTEVAGTFAILRDDPWWSTANVQLIRVRLEGRLDGADVDLRLHSLGAWSVADLTEVAGRFATSVVGPWRKAGLRSGSVALDVRLGASLARPDDGRWSWSWREQRATLTPCGLRARPDGVPVEVGVDAGEITADLLAKRIELPGPLALSAGGTPLHMKLEEGRLSLAPTEPLAIDPGWLADVGEALELDLSRLPARGQLRLQASIALAGADAHGIPFDAELGDFELVVGGSLRAGTPGQLPALDLGERGLTARGRWPDGLRVELAGTFGSAPLRCRLEATSLDGLCAGTGSVTLDGLRIDPGWRLPEQLVDEAIRAAWVEAAARGSLDLELVASRWPALASGPAALDWRARLAIRDGALRLDETPLEDIALALRARSSPTGELAIQLDEGSLALRGQRVEDIRAAASYGAGGLTCSRLEARALGGRLSLSEPARWRPATEQRAATIALAARLRGVKLSAELASLLPAEERQRWRELAPQGQLEADLTLGGSVDDPTIEAQLRLRELALTIAKLEETLRCPMLALRYGGGRLELSEPARLALGRARLTIRGGVSSAAPQRGELTVAVEQLDLEDPWIIRAAGADGVEVWGELRLSGHLAGQLALTIDRGAEQPVRLRTGRLVSKDLGLQLLEFDHPLRDIRCALELSPGGVKLVGGSGRLGDTHFAALSGSFRVEDGEKEMDLLFRGSGVRASAWTQYALDKDFVEAYEMFEPRGTFDVEVHLLRRFGQMTQPRITLIATGDGSLRFIDFPVEVTNLRGRVVFGKQELLVQNLRGRTCNGELVANGRILRGSPKGLDLTIHATGVRCVEALRSALPIEYHSVWDLLGPVGTFDVDVALMREPSKDQLHKLITVRPRGITLLIDGVRMPFAFDRGEVRMTHARVQLVEVGVGDELAVNGVIAESAPAAPSPLTLAAPLVSAGTAQPRESERWMRLRARLDDVPLDAARAKAISKLLPGGLVLTAGGAIRRADVTMEGAQAGRRQLAWTARGELVDLELIAPISVTRINSLVDARGRGGDGAPRASARLRDFSARVFGAQVKDATARLLLAGGFLHAERVEGVLSGGRMRARASADLSDARPYQLQLRVENLSLAQLELAKEVEGLRGSMTGAVQLEGFGDDLATMHGEGAAVIEDGSLWRLPIFLALFEAFDLKKRSAFHSGALAWKVRKSKLHFERLRFDSRPVSLGGRGTLGFDGQIDVTLTSKFAPETIPELPIVSALWRKLKQSMIPVRIRGPIRSPRVDVGPIGVSSAAPNDR